jgi:hypothetical protein
MIVGGAGMSGEPGGQAPAVQCGLPSVMRAADGGIVPTGHVG